jgi:hypothetical protein
MDGQQGQLGELRYYRLWSEGHWFDQVIEVEERYQPTVRGLFPKDLSDEGTEVFLDAELVPELNGALGLWSIAIRVAGRTIGYLSKEKAGAWAGVIRRVIASGYIPVTASRIYAREYDGFDGPEFWTNAQVALGDRSEALPQNQPPSAPYTMLPKSSILQVTKEEQYFDALLKVVPSGGHGVFFATLHERPAEGQRKALVEVRVDDACVGQLTPQTSQRFLPMIRHLGDRGLLDACWSDVTGSTVAAEVRINAVKANEASAQVLDGPPVTVPPLVRELSDPLQYDLSAMLAQLKPLAPIRPAKRRVLEEPPQSAVIRFTKGGRYNYVAVRYGDNWLTTATGDWGAINQVMSWRELGPRLSGFDYATAVDPINLLADPRVRQHLAVVCFLLGDFYVAAINISGDETQEGNWYTTIPDVAASSSPIGSGCVTMPEIARWATDPRLITTWTHFD